MATNSRDEVIRGVRIELPDDVYRRMERSAARYALSVSAFIRLAVIERIERDEASDPGR